MPNFNKENLENLSDINNFPIVKPQFQSDSPQNHWVPISSNLNYCLTLFIPWTGALTIFKIEITPWNFQTHSLATDRYVLDK